MVFNHRKIDEILDALFPLPEHFGVNTDNELIDLDLIKEAICDVDPYAFISFGVSKLVIISDEIGDVVIKIPFKGFIEDSYYDEEKEEYVDLWYNFSCAAGSDPGDYCLAEYEKFRELYKHQLDCFVAKTIYYQERDGIRIFIQEKVTPEDDLWDTPQASQASKNIAKKWYEEGFWKQDKEWIANCIDKYGQEKVKQFLNYCTDIDPDILADIHPGNYGYRSDNTPVILDYSNYND